MQGPDKLHNGVITETQTAWPKGRHCCLPELAAEAAAEAAFPAADAAADADALPPPLAAALAAHVQN